jgi:hypothetical protein
MPSISKPSKLTRKLSVLSVKKQDERDAFNEYISAVADAWIEDCRNAFPTPKGAIENIIRTARSLDQDWTYTIGSDISYTGVPVGREILTLKGRKRLGLKVERYTQTLQYRKGNKHLNLYSERYQESPIVTITRQTYSRYNPEARMLAYKFGVSCLPHRDRAPTRSELCE